MGFLFKHRKIILACIILLGFALRIYYINTNVCSNDDPQHIIAARQISLNPKNLQLPLVDKQKDSCPMGIRYVMRLGLYLFDKPVLGIKFPCMLFQLLAVFMVYRFAKRYFGIEVALLAAFLLSIAQYNIGNPSTNGVMHTLTMSYFLIVLKSIDENKKKWLLLSGVVLGIGFWFREHVPLIALAAFLFLLFSKEDRHWLRSKYLWFSFGIAFLLGLPLLISNFNPEINRFEFILEESAIGPSLNAIGTYLGEFILLIVKPFPELFQHVASSLDAEYPPVNFVLGAIILISVGLSVKKAKPATRLLVTCFLVNFFLFSFIRRNDVIESFWSLGSLDWSGLGFTSGIILAADRLIYWKNKYGIQAKIAIGLIIIFTLARSWSFIIFPLNAYFPVKYYRVKIDSFENAQHFLDKGLKNESKRLLRVLCRISKKGTPYAELHRPAAAKLVKIFLKEGQYKKAGKYLYRILSRNPNDAWALSLIERLSFAKRDFICD
jgi:4-amino-4-deoxy-L-arabinose transferase-like glycosyltransferase